MNDVPKMTQQTITPTALAVEIWGQAENTSRARGPRRVRVVARRLFPADAPGKGGEWHLTPAQAAAIRRIV